MAENTVNTGKELERCVANAYRALGARKVEHDVELAGHQIDVYVELETQDRGLHRIAVEAKDYASKVGIGIVNDFLAVVDHLRRGQLIDEGVIVSVEGFSRPARNAAQTASIRLLELHDLRRNIVVHDLLQEHLASITQIEAPLTSLLHNRFLISYLREAVCAGLDIQQLPEHNLGARLECIVLQVVERNRLRLSDDEYGQVPSAEEFCRLLSYLGWHMFSEGITSCDATSAAAVIEEILGEMQMDQYSIEQILDWLAASYWLRKTSRNALEFRDSHIVNAFAAMELKQRLLEEGDNLMVIRLGRTGSPGYSLADDLAKWQQVIIPLAGMLTQDRAIELIEFLLEEKLIRLAGWCIAEGQLMPHFIVARVFHALLAQLAEVEQQ